MPYRIIPASDIVGGGISFWQSPLWGDIVSDSGQAQEGFYFGDVDSSYLFVEIRSLGLGCFGAFALGLMTPQVGADWTEMIVELQIYLKTKNILFLQIEPLDGDLTNLNTRKPYKKFLTPHTRIIDISLTEDEILAQMHEKGRYNIRLALKRGVSIGKTPITPENINIWMDILSDTLDRDGFAGNSRRYYQIFLENLEKNNQGGLYFAWFEGRVIAGGIFVFTPYRAIYYYGASSSSSIDRKQMAPYLLQWTAICEAKSRNIGVYDLLGVADPSDPDDSLRGVTDFKEKFGGTIEILPQKILYPLSWRYDIFAGLQKIKNLLKRR